MQDLEAQTRSESIFAKTGRFLRKSANLENREIPVFPGISRFRKKPTFFVFRRFSTFFRRFFTNPGRGGGSICLGALFFFGVLKKGLRRRVFPALFAFFRVFCVFCVFFRKYHPPWGGLFRTFGKGQKSVFSPTGEAAKRGYTWFFDVFSPLFRALQGGKSQLFGDWISKIDFFFRVFSGFRKNTFFHPSGKKRPKRRKVRSSIGDRRTLK